MEDIFGYCSEIKLNVGSRDQLRNLEVLREILRYNVAFAVATTG